MNAEPDRRPHSPFWALLAVFLTLIGLQTSYLIEDLGRRSQLQIARAQIRTPLAQAQAIDQTVEAVGHELTRLALDSTEAAKIVAEFKITIDNPGMRGK